MEYTPKTFTIPTLDGISEESIKQHIGLYEGYVKNFNAISAELADTSKDTARGAHASAELVRRRSFEFDGMRLHELYFAQFENGATPLSNGALAQRMTEEYGSIEQCIKVMTSIGNMRGPGWAILYYDPLGQQLLTGFSGEQHQGHFVTLPIILALDVWEHAFLLDYGALGKGKYLDAFFKNLNWKAVEERFVAAQK
jgi:Fe-Mn family superoxide dismutase